MGLVHKYSLVTVLLASTAIATTVQADDSADLGGFEDIIVRSSPLRSTLDEVALGTTIVGREELKRDLNGTIGETLSRQPGVSSTFFGPGASRPIIRGLGGDRIRILSNDISTFDVSTASNDHLVGTEVATAQQVEILRGAATLRYGQNAIGGVVNVFDNRIPRARPEGGYDLDATAAYSTVDNGYTFGGSVEADLGTGLVLHVDGNKRDSEDYEIPGFASEEAEEEGVEGIVENSKSKASSATVGLSWIGDNGYIGVAVGLQQGKYGLPGGKKKEEEDEEEDETLDFLTSDAEDDEEEGPITIDFEQVRIDLDAEYNFDGGLVRLAKFRFGWSDYEHTEFAGDEPETLFTNDEWELRAETFFNEFEMGAGVLTGTVGFNMANREFEAAGDEAFVPLNEQFRWGLFGLARYSLDKLILEGSVRLDSQDNETTNLAFAGQDFDANVTTYSAALTGIYEISDGTNVGINLARSERAPTAEELFSNGFHPATQTVEIGDVNLDTEVAYSAELSFKTNVGPVSFGANIYYTDYSNFIFLSPTGDFFEEGDPFPADEGLPVFAYQQADAELYGFEFEADYLAIDTPEYAVAFDAQIDLARGRTTESTTFGGVANVRDEFTPLGGSATTVPSGDLPFFPPVRFLAGVDMEYKPLKSRLRLEIQHVGEQTRVGEVPDGTEVDIAGTIPTDSFTFFNVYFDVKPLPEADNLSLFIRGRNLTNSFARSSTSFLAQSAPLPGRDIRFGVNIQF
ncbi:MAG: TonB-dependent receptor [Pseudomonadota bacterium]